MSYDTLVIIEDGRREVWRSTSGATTEDEVIHDIFDGADRRTRPAARDARLRAAAELRDEGHVGHQETEPIEDRVRGRGIRVKSRVEREW